jgi:hypothetical protein
MGRVDRNLAVPRHLLGRLDVNVRLVNINADEVEWGRDRLQLVGGELRGVGSGTCEVGVGVPAFQQHGGEVGIFSRVAVSAALTYSGVSMTGTAVNMFSAKPNFAPDGAGRADRVHG